MTLSLRMPGGRAAQATMRPLRSFLPLLPLRIRSSRPSSLLRPRAASSSSSTSPSSNNGDETLNGSSSAAKISSGGSGAAKRGAGDSNSTAPPRAVAAAATTSTATTAAATATTAATTATSTSSPPSPPLPPPSHDDLKTSWEAWQAHFASCDEAAELAEDASDALALAVEAEEYGAAAAANGRLDSLAAGDAVARVQLALAEALREEDYAEAARLRDDGGAGLVGWWHGEKRVFSSSSFLFFSFFVSSFPARSNLKKKKN